MAICDALLEEASWSAFDVNNAPPLNPNHRPQRLYDANTRFSRAVTALARRVLYVPAGRQPSFGAEAAFTELSQDDMAHVTRLLLRLQAVNRPAFDGLSGSLSLLFPETRRLVFAGVGGALVPQVEFTDDRTEHVGNLGFAERASLAHRRQHGPARGRAHHR